MLWFTAKLMRCDQDTDPPDLYQSTQIDGITIAADLADKEGVSSAVESSMPFMDATACLHGSSACVCAI